MAAGWSDASIQLLPNCNKGKLTRPKAEVELDQEKGGCEYRSGLHLDGSVSNKATSKGEP